MWIIDLTHFIQKKNKNILNIKGPRIVHVVTKKGKGYSSAEEEPVRFHGIGPFDIQTGSLLQKQSGQKSYTDIFSAKLLELATITEEGVRLVKSRLSVWKEQFVILELSAFCVAVPTRTMALILFTYRISLNMIPLM